ncbi:MAG: TonB-dependent receptor domain-containing protein [Bacteroidota bacterium]
MKFIARFLGMLSLVLSVPAYAQMVRITGTVTDAKTREALPSARVTVGSTKVVTDLEGTFVVQGVQLPATILVEAFAYEPYRAEVRNANPLNIKLTASSVELSEAQIVASKISEKQKQAPLTVEALDLVSMKEAPAPNFYEALGNMKGVDLTSASIGFKIINTRGFNSTSPVRSLQVIDGVDNQAPGLNFSLGNFLGASELDVQQVDVISGAVGALYGPSAFNGVVAMTTKDPYRFQGTSVQFKGGERRLAEFGFRHAQAFKRADGSASWAYKINLFALRADDWEATNLKPTDGSASAIGNPGGYDAVNRYGDEITYDDGGDVKTYAGIGTYHRRGIEESALVDYSTENLKMATSVHYRSRAGMEAIYALNYGTGTTVYQGDNRFSLKDIQFLQNRVELRKGEDWFVRAYTTHEDAGKTYDAYFTALRMQDSVLNDGFWANQYRSFWTIFQKPVVRALPGYPDESLSAADFSAAMAQLWADNPGVFDSLHASNRNWMDMAYDPDSMLIPGSAAFAALKQSIISRPFTEGGSQFWDRSSLAHLHAQRAYDVAGGRFTLGSSLRQYRPNSRGTLFSDTNGRVLRVAELGMYAGYTRNWGERWTANVTARADKNQNFDWLFSPAASVVFRPNERTVWRVGFSSAVRNPTLQDQFLYYNVGRALLLGNLNGYDSLVTVDEVSDFLKAGPQARADWQWQYYSRDAVRPEQVRNVEVGYRTTWWDRLYLDATYYMSWYTDFIGYHLGLRIEDDPGGSAANRLSSVQAYRIASNATEQVTTQGFSLGANYYFARYTLAANYTWNVLNAGEDDPIIPAYNTPEHKYNVSLAGRDLDWKLGKGRCGFNVTYKWVEGFLFEGSPQFTGRIPSYSLVDAQVSWAKPDQVWQVKLGSSNLLNQKVVQVYGGPAVGRLTYLSLTWNAPSK